MCLVRVVYMPERNMKLVCPDHFDITDIVVVSDTMAVDNPENEHVKRDDRFFPLRYRGCEGI